MRYLIALLMGTILCGATLQAADWHHPLYIGNGGVWRQRIAIHVHNPKEQQLPGETIWLKIGNGPGEIPLGGARVESLRVCDEAGAEYLYALYDAQGQLIRRGPAPSVGDFIFATDVPPRGDRIYYVYFDNPVAWPVPDFLEAFFGVRNGSVEFGEGDTPTGWRHDPGDDQHRALWVTENPHSGKRCLKTIVTPGAEKTWIATRQGGIRIIPGAKYVMTAWVKAENVEGNAGWYIHVGNAQNYMIISPMLYGGGGTYDWKQVRAEFIAPPDADRADLGTVLWGTGTAWFDDVILETEARPALETKIDPPERFPFQEIDQKPATSDWLIRVPLRVLNQAPTPRRTLIVVTANGLLSRLQQEKPTAACRLMQGDKTLTLWRLGDLFVFQAQLPPRSHVTYYLLFGGRGSSPVSAADYEQLLNSPLNLAKNPSFEMGERLPDDWPGGAEGEKPAGTILGFDEPGLFGRRCVKIFVPHDAPPAWTGWRQNVPVEPGKTYLYAAWLKCADLKGSLQLHAHKRTATGELCKEAPYTGTGPALSSTKDWTLLCGLFTMPEDCRIFQLHLTMHATGTAWHDGVLLMEAEQAELGPPEGRPAKGLEVWPVPAIVKVFRHDVPPPSRDKEATALNVTLARNEYEPLQLALRSPQTLRGVRVTASQPIGAGGRRLPAPQINIVGYVPIDHAGGYYSSQREDWQRRLPSGTGGSDGWAGLWPDPLLPDRGFDLAPQETQPVWITYHAPPDASPGLYSSLVRLVKDGRTLWQGRVQLTVRRFALPQEGHFAAIYDCRQSGSLWQIPGKTLQETRQAFWRFMAERRVCPDRIQPDPKLEYKDGRVIADFTEYDKAAEYYFNVLKLPHSYTPGVFYLFGWGHPPGNKFGEKPYEGEYPYEGVDRGRLRPEYKRAYQSVLKAYWEHVKAKGWADRIVLYISDEPFDWQPEIRAQMKALCDMIHEVDPTIRIYCSIWHEQPEWEGGYLDVWGVGHFGCFSVEKMKQLQAAGDTIWWTTDGQMCTDTPYCAIERLLPYYGFKYGAKAYEFWGIDWLTYNPYEFGWHSFIKQSGTPGKIDCVRYPCGDGFLAYPGKPIGYNGPVSSVRLEQAREGMEDYEYLWLLNDLLQTAKRQARPSAAMQQAIAAGESALAEALSLVTIPTDYGRFSTRILPHPEALYRARERCAQAIEALLGKR